MGKSFWLWIVLAMTCSSQALAEDVEASRPPRVFVPLFEQEGGIRPTTLPATFIADGQLEEWAGIVPPQVSSNEIDQPAFSAWVAETADGLAVVWPGVLAAGEHLHMELASLALLDLPEIGWQQRFGTAVSYSDAQACFREHPAATKNYSVARCEQWYASQVAYRQQLVDRFVRHIDINQEGAISSHSDADPALPLRPDTLPAAKSGKDGIEIMLPWNALPATDALVLSRVYLRLALCTEKEHGAQAKNCRELILRGQPENNDPPRPVIVKSVTEPYFTPLLLGSPRHYAVTACALPLLGDRSAGWGAMERGYFLPGTSFEVNQVMAMHQPALPYQDAPAGMSPTPILSHYQSHALGQGEWLCYPPLTWKHGKKLVTDSSNWYGTDDIASAGYGTLQIDATNLLVVSGPFEHYSRSGMGQCGACPRQALAIWYLDRGAGTLTTALTIDDIVDGFEDGASIRMTIGDDGRHVDYAYDRCTLAMDEDQDYSDEQEAHSRRCTRLKIEWCLEEAAREYTECHRSEESIPEPFPD